MTCGIYKITENETGRCYIGQSKNVESRWKAHHKKFPISDFSYEVIMECDKEQLAFWEIAWIASERSIEFGFNTTVGGNGAWGSKNPEETGRRISEAKKGKRHSIETIAKMSESQKGIEPSNKGKKTGPLSEETKAKISESIKARWARRKNDERQHERS